MIIGDSIHAVRSAFHLHAGSPSHARVSEDELVELAAEAGQETEAMA